MPGRKMDRSTPKIRAIHIRWGGRRSCFPWVIFLVSLTWIFTTGCLSQATASDNPWNEVPETLKQQAGALKEGETIYATGRATAAKGIRPDKAHETARKKSLMRALQRVYLFASCRHLTASPDPEAPKHLERILLSIMGPVTLKDVRVIRQWEQGEDHFTTVSVPFKSVQGMPCRFPDLSAVIIAYVDVDVVTLAELGFCVRRVSPYSHLGRKVRERIGRWYEKKGMKAQALCFLDSPERLPVNPGIEPFVFQNRLSHAARLTEKAKGLVSASNWKDALTTLTEALDLTPDYSRAYLILADYFLNEEQKPAFALFAAERALRDGTCFKQALSRMSAALNAFESPEAQIYDALLSRLIPRGNESESLFLPEGWNVTLRILEVGSVPYMVISSLGRVVAGAPQKPDPLFFDARKRFMKAKTDQDLGKVIRLLMAACEKQPFSPETYNLLAACFRHLDRPTLALPFLWQALNLKPSYDYALTNLGLCCQKMGLMQAAGFYFEQKAVKESPTPWVRETYAAFKKAGRYENPDPATPAE